MLALAGRIAADAIIFVLNPQRFWEQADVVQGIWEQQKAAENALRDEVVRLSANRPSPK